MSLLRVLLNLLARLLRLLRALFGVAPPVNKPPSIQILTTGSSFTGPFVRVDYKLYDPESDPVRIVVSYSTNGGATFQPAREATGVGSSGTTGLTSGVSGIAHTFVWDGSSVASGSNVLLRFETFDANTGGVATMGPFQVIVSTTNPNLLVSILDPHGGVWGVPVPVRYSVAHPNSISVRIEPAFSIDGGATFRPATRDTTAGGDDVVNLSTTPNGSIHIFNWDARNDFASVSQPNVLFRIQAFDPQPGPPVTSALFDVMVNAPPRIKIAQPSSGAQVYSPVSIFYDISDAESDPTDIEVLFSIDNGITFSPATSLNVPQNDGAHSLSSSPTGSRHLYVWNAGAISAPQDVLVRIQTLGLQPRGEDTAGPIRILQAPPISVRITSPRTGTWGVPVPVRYALFDAASSPMRAEFSYSTDQGVTFTTCREAAGVGSEGTSNLASGPSEVFHFFAWDAEADLAVLPATNLILRVKVFTTTDQAEARTSLFDVDNTIVGSPPQPPGPIAAPQAHVFDPVTHSGIHVPVRFLATQDDNARINMDVEVDAGQGWQNATPARGSDFMTNLAAPSVSAAYRFLWNAAADLQQSGSAKLRLTPYIGGVSGSPQETGSFQVTVVPPTPVATPTAPPASYLLTITKEAGDNQKGLARLLMPQVLKVKVQGPSGPLAGVRVSFEAKASVFDVDIEDDPTLSTTTDSSGYAGIRVRPGAVTAQSPFQVVATVAGVPKSQVTFNLTAFPARIVPAQFNPSGTVRYGETFTYTFYLDGDGDTTTADFMREDDNPIEFEITTHNCEANLKRAYLPGIGGSSANSIAVEVTPTLLGGPLSTDYIEVEVRVPGDPSIPAVRARNGINTPVNGRHLSSAGPGGRVYQDLQIYLSVEKGLDPVTGTPQRAYPGGTLATEFLVHVKDQLGNNYVRAIDPADANRCIVGTISPLDLMLKWTCSGGVISETMDRGNNDTELVLRHDKKIYFTPVGDGPWLVSVTIDSAYVLDPRAQLFTWINSSGGQDCAMQAGIGAYARRDFHIQIPESFEIVDKTTSSPVESLKAGTIVRVIAGGLSPYAPASSFQEIDMRSLDAAGNDIRTYTGYGWNFRNRTLAVSALAADSVATREILIVRGDPENTAGLAPVQQSILPGAWLRAEANDIRTSVPTSRLNRRRLMTGGVEAMYESPTGTTPRGGANGTVIIPSGDFVYGAADLSVTSRNTSLAMNRHYRYQFVCSTQPDDVAEPLGPGWSGEIFEYLEVERKHLRWWDGSGRYDDLYDDQPWTNPAKGLFLTLDRKAIVDHDNSPFEITDAHRNKAHFNVDGSLRFYIDRQGNRTTFKYDRFGRLTRMEDPITPQRWIAFEYFDNSGAAGTTSGTIDEWNGRLRRVTDHTGREVLYEYFGKNDPKGGAGWLNRVSLPKARTLVGGAVVPDFQRYERYDYEADPDIEWRMTRIVVLDENGSEQDFLVNHYAGNRVVQQDHGTGNFKFTYTPAPAAGAPSSVLVENRKSQQTFFEFPQSPYWDGVNASLAREVTAGNLETRRRYSTDGKLVEETIPGGETTVFVFDDQSPYTRSRGNLKAKIHTAPTGESRVWTYQYSLQFNFISHEIGPAGHMQGADPELSSIHHNYDPATGNVTAQMRPRLLNTVMVPRPGNVPRIQWVDENPRCDFSYNAYGQLQKQVDEMGIVTAYTYYSNANPTGGADSPDGGGFLASVTRDAEMHARRDWHFPNVPLEPRTGRYRYNDLGDVIEHTDFSGTVHTFEFNALRERIRFTADSSASSAVTEFEHSPAGFMAQRVSRQSSGASLIERTSHDIRGNMTSQLVTAAGSAPFESRVERDANDDAEKIYPFEHGIFGATETTVGYDERRNMKSVRQGSDAFNCGTAPEGVLESVERPGDGSYSLPRTALGDASGVVDPNGAATNSTAETGADDRLLVKRGASVTSFSERRIDEGGRITRIHRGRFVPAAASTTTTATATRIRKVADYMPYQQGQKWPPVDGTTLDDGAWGKGDGRTTADLRYDAWNLPSWVSDDETGFAWCRRNAHGQLLEVGDPEGNRIEFTYDAAGNRTDIQRHFNYRDSMGMPRTKTLSQHFEYDALGRVTRAIDGLGNAHGYDYDELGFNHTSTDAMGNTTIQERDALGRVTRREIALAASKVIREMTYYDGGPLKEIIEQGGARTEWQYYPDGKLQKIVCHGAADWATEFTYMPDSSRVLTQTDGNGTTLTNTYDGDFITSVQVQLGPASPNVRLGGTLGYDYQYDGSGHLAAASEPVTGGYRIAFAHDSEGNGLSETHPNETVAFSYDGAGRRTSVEFPGYGPVRYTYNRAGYLTEVATGSTTGGTTAARYEYLGNDRIVSRNLNGIRVDFDLDDAGRLTGVHTVVSSTVAFVYALQLDGEGRIVRKVRDAGGMHSEWTWVYDNAGRLINEAFVPLAGAQPLVTERFFDGDDVLLREARPHETIDLTRAERGRITRRNNGASAVDIKYDIKGNLTDDGRRQYVYDAWDRLIRVEENGQVVVMYDYDPFHRVIRRTKGADIEEYVWDGWSLLAVRRNGVIQERYVYANSPEDLITASVGGQDYTVLISPEGNVDALVDSSRNVSEQYLYDPHGLATAFDAAGQPRASAVAPLSRFLFKRRWFDPGTGLYYFRRRWFHAEYGFFLTPDPLLYAESPNHYGMTHGDPVNYTDAMGYYSWKEFWSDAKTTGARFAGGCYGAGANFAGFLRAGLYDSWAQTFDSDARTRVVQGQEWFGDMIEAIRTHRFIDWVAEGVDERVERVYQLEKRGRHFDAATTTGDTLMNVYYVGRGGYSVVRGGGGFLRGVRTNGLGYTVRGSFSSLRTWAFTYEGLGTGLESLRTPGIENSFRNSLLRRAMALEEPPNTLQFSFRNWLYRLGRPNPGRFQSWLKFEDIGNGRVSITRQLGTGAEGDLLGEPVRWEVPLDADPAFLSRMLRAKNGSVGGHHNGLPGTEPPSWVPDLAPLLIRDRNDNNPRPLRVIIVAPPAPQPAPSTTPPPPPGQQQVPGSDRGASDGRATGGTNTR